MDTTIKKEVQPTPFECLIFLMQHITALHMERDEYPPPDRVNQSIDRIHDYLLGNGL